MQNYSICTFCRVLKRICSAKQMLIILIWIFIISLIPGTIKYSYNLLYTLPQCKLNNRYWFVLLVSKAGDGQRRILKALFNNSDYSIYDRPVANETETLNVKIEYFKNALIQH